MIRIRGLTILMPNGWVTTVHLPSVSSETPEVESAAEVVSVLEKYRNGLQRLIARSPSLTMGKGKSYANLDEMIHTLVNARKHLDMPVTDSTELSEHYYLDLINQTITFHNMSTGEERGSMPLKMFYANWREMFYSDAMTEEDDILPDPLAEIDLGESLKVLVPGSAVVTIDIDSDGKVVTTSMGSIVEDMTKHLEDAAPEYLFPFLGETHEEDAVKEILGDPEPTHAMGGYAYLARYAEKMKEEIDETDYALWERSIQVLADHDTGDVNLDNMFIRIDYSGGGDSGGTDNIKITDSTFHNLVDKLGAEQYDDLDKLAWNVIHTEESGFYNDDGGYGYFIIGPQKYVWKHFNYTTSEDQTINHEKFVE